MTSINIHDTRDLSLYPDLEVDYLLAVSLGYKMGKDLVKYRYPRTPHIEVFHDGIWRTFSHKDPSVLWPIVVVEHLMPYVYSPLIANPRPEDKIIRYAVRRINGNDVVFISDSYHNRLPVLAETPEKALAFAIILKNQGLAA